MLSRMETMTLMGIDLPLEAIRRQIASGVDILVHLGRMRDKSRKLLEITEVCGFEDRMKFRPGPLYQWQEGKGLVKTAVPSDTVKKLDTGRDQTMKKRKEESEMEFMRKDYRKYHFSMNRDC